MKGSRILYIVLIVAVIASVVFGLSGLRSGSKPAATPTPQSTPVPAGEYMTYTDQTHGFSISDPKGWTKISEQSYGENTLVAFTSGTSCGGAPQYLQVEAIELSNPMTVEDYCLAVRNQYSGLEGYIFISQEQLTVGGFPAIKHIYTLTSGGLTGQVMQLLIVRETTAWSVTCQVSTSCWTAYKPIFDTIAGSFTLLD